MEKEKQISLKEKQVSILSIQLNNQKKACSMHKIKENIMVQNHATQQFLEKLFIVQKVTFSVEVANYLGCLLKRKCIVKERLS